ncbi:polyketide synthase [Streptomyces cyaneofuscatus]|uniref:Acyltransferase domain-containing protein n=1 Tax=Streptomyces cyaneofuscatus TaxID=66883 RepID=A0ABZ1EW10_9ACTN|nr:polyketide synthase [Streptomyces cyaneofuscatus]WSB08287.1 acyltransferase domain-containing protein [Streptomyces cyaneofuscatus]WSD48180.1 acyltransferase domain-containing protein [Streptomyces cyaneofuscatus]WTA91553.1 acyltransferase domain-containing protein [Streptomyces cyaneofuscatus]
MRGGRDDSIAIIGMAGRFPGARDLAEFWNNLRAQVTSITELSDEQLRNAGVAEQYLTDPDYVRAAPLLDGVDLFEPGLFGITPREAEGMDPQFRVLLEICHTALQDAGYDPGTFWGRIGMYSGARSNEYFGKNVRADPRFLAMLGEARARIFNHTDFMATNVSFRLGLRGPGINSVTACSTSLVTAHMACAALLNDECDMALAGGIEIPLPMHRGYQYSEGAGFLAADGVVRPFDAKASGTVFGAGVGVVVLKRLTQALADRDAIHAVILGSAINNDGAGKASYAAPSEAGQTEVVAEALRRAAVDPRSIGYVEAHGTGTPLGDPIEVAALNRVYGADRKGSRDCGLGSVKGNVGHLGAAAGICGLVKAVYTVREGVIPASLNFDEPNPRIDFDEGPFRVVDRTTAWPLTRTARRAAVSSFGVGGTNAHMILEQPPPARSEPSRRPYQLLPFSVRTPTAAAALADRFGRYLDEPGISLPDVSYTLTEGRSELPLRHALVVGTQGDAVRQLREGALTGSVRTIPQGLTPKLAYLLPGQGSQYSGMTRGLYTSEPVFAAAIDRCANILRASHGLDLTDVLFSADAGDGRIDRTSVTQPALFAVEYALAVLLHARGLEPDAMVGHSIGEYVAAALAGVMEVDDALRLVADRGALVESLPPGAMAAVFLPEAELVPRLTPEVDIAAVNSRGISVISGPCDAVERLRESLARQDVGTARLRASHAFHSRMMEPVLEKLRERVDRVRLRAPSIPFVSTVTGDWITADQATDPDYWARHVRMPVRFSDAAGVLTAGGGYVFAEVGPGHALTNLIRESSSGASPVGAPMVQDRQGGLDDARVLLEGIGTLWSHGVRVRWDRYWSDEQRGRLHLPTYPYDRDRFWVDPAEPDADAGGENLLEDNGALYAPTWTETSLPAAAVPGASARADDDASWMVFAHPNETVTTELLRLAGESSRRLIVVNPGAEFAEKREGGFVVRPREPDDYVRLMARVLEAGHSRFHIVHAWLLGNPPLRKPQATVRAQLDFGLHSLLATLQAVSGRASKGVTKVSVVTSGLQDVAGDGSGSHPVKAAVYGLIRTVPREVRSVVVRGIDVGTGHADIAGQLFRELGSKAYEREVVYRGRRRWVASHSRIDLPAPEGVPAVLEERGVYLVTGGLGGLGLQLAAQLARLVRARLVLVGRSGLPSRPEWASLVEESHDEELVARIRCVLAVEKAGGEVMLCVGDVADETRMRAIRAEVMQTFGKVSGVFHLAGVAGGGLIELRSAAEVDRVVTPKIHGTYVLDRVFRPPLFILYSSIAAITGDYGQSDYAGANAFLDAYAQAEWAAGRHVVSVNWPQWAGAGMAQRSQRALDVYGEGAITAREGGEILHSILASRWGPQVIVSPGGLRRRRRHADRVASTVAGGGPVRSAGSAAERQVKTPYVAPGSRVEQAVAALWQQAVGLERIGLDDDFQEVGGSSIVAVRLVHHMSALFRVELSLAEVYQWRTVRVTAAAIDAVIEERARQDARA